MSDPHTNKIMEFVMTLIDKNDKAGDPEAVLPIIRELLHTAGHLGLAGGLSLPEYTALCVEESLEASKCLAASLLQEALTKGLEQRAQTIPDDQKN